MWKKNNNNNNNRLVFPSEQLVECHFLLQAEFITHLFTCFFIYIRPYWHCHRGFISKNALNFQTPRLELMTSNMKIKHIGI